MALQIPFGRIDRNIVLEAKSILEELKDLVQDCEAIQERRLKNNSDALQNSLFETLERVTELSSEYYFRIPKRGFEYTSLEPIDNQQILTAEMKRVTHMLGFETAERLLLAAQYNKDK